MLPRGGEDIVVESNPSDITDDEIADLSSNSSNGYGDDDDDSIISPIGVGLSFIILFANFVNGSLLVN